MRRPGVVFSALLTATAATLAAQQPVVRTADPARRGFRASDFPRTVKVSDNVYTYEDFHAGDEKFTTTNMFVVTDAGVLVADGQGDPEATGSLVRAIAKITPGPIKYVVICSDHADHTGGNASFPADVTYLIHPTSKATLERQRDRTGRVGLEAAARRRSRAGEENDRAGVRRDSGHVSRPGPHRR